MDEAICNTLKMMSEMENRTIEREAEKEDERKMRGDYRDRHRKTEKLKTNTNKQLRMFFLS